jgi:Fe-S-cluster containining protein
MKKIACQRCGICCTKGGPVLHREDLPLITGQTIQPHQLVVIRQGEPAYNPATDQVEPAVCEMLKIQGTAGSWQCLFYDAHHRSCTIHAGRPLECRLLHCRDTRAVLAVTGRDCLTRRDLISADDPALAFLQAFEHCSWQRLNDLLASPDPAAIEAAEEILAADLHLRQQAIHRLQLSLAQELFYFGRPLFQAWHHPDIELVLDHGLPRLRRRANRPASLKMC